MTSADKLAELFSNRESFDKSIQFMMNSILNNLHPDFVKELNWLLDGQYHNFVSITKRNLQKVYTEEELELLYKIYTENPWMAPKAEQIAQLNATEAMEFGKVTAEMVANNLKETGDLERIMNEGFYIHEEEEEFPDYFIDENEE